jgi:NAD(P)-dependent dehydrogenase (short-subunit alcohol dehydrogenase family)
MPPFPSLSARGKTIAITGGGGAIRKAIALSFSHAADPAILLLDRTLLTLQSAKSAIETQCPNNAIHIHTRDVTSKRSVDETFTAIHASHRPIHLLINSADFMAAAHPVSAAEWWGVHQPNVLGTLLVSQAFLAHSAPHAQCALINISAGADPPSQHSDVECVPILQAGGRELINSIGTEIWSCLF